MRVWAGICARSSIARIHLISLVLCWGVCVCFSCYVHSELGQAKAAVTSEQAVRATLETEKAALVKDRDGVILDVDRLVLRVKDMDR